MGDTAAVQVTGITTVGIPVTDQDRALGFYLDTLGLETRMDVPTPGGGRWITVGPRGSAGPSLALVAAHDGVPAGVETGIRLATADAEAARRELVAAGVDCDEILRWPGVPPMFRFRDGDGNGLELVESPPAAS
ncbi:MAG: VOC family protein [Acidobacteriota bacterium]|nr:VOC family protein [Acidobacteriota bacterium]